MQNDTPGFAWLSGPLGARPHNAARPMAGALPDLEVRHPSPTETGYFLRQRDGPAIEAWDIRLAERTIILTSETAAGVDFPALPLCLAPGSAFTSTHPSTDSTVINLPCVLTLADGTRFRITGSIPEATLSVAPATKDRQEVDFPPAWEKLPYIEYSLEAWPPAADRQPTG